MEYNLLQLAYVGDAVYELEIRDYLIKQNIVKTKELKTISLQFVSATRQAFYLNKLQDKNIFDEEELEILRKGRNVKVNSKPKNCDIITYHHATALEVLIGYLYTSKNIKRIKELIEEIIKIYNEEK